MIDPPRLANLLSAGQPYLNFFYKKRNKSVCKGQPDPRGQYEQADGGRHLHPPPDVLPTQPIPVSRHRNRYKGQPGSTHSISRRCSDSDPVLSPATHSVNHAP